MLEYTQGASLGYKLLAFQADCHVIADNRIRKAFLQIWEIDLQEWDIWKG